jgi:hypothetical protein
MNGVPTFFTRLERPTLLPMRLWRQHLEPPNYQFGILVGVEDAEDYYLSFPTDLLDFEDGTCWLECHLRGKTDNALLVAMGWDLRQRPSDGAWLVDSIDWQDFRDRYCPGIGREEWMRICG